MAGETDRVFKALADPTRRSLLDSLRERNGQTLVELCHQLDMARQSASQHLGGLEAANLVSTVWHGREKFDDLNPVPIYEIQDRWIGKFERPRLQALTDLKRRAEENEIPPRPAFGYVTYIQATPQDVWHALTDADLTAQYWGHSNVSRPPGRLFSGSTFVSRLGNRRRRRHGAGNCATHAPGHDLRRAGRAAR